MSASPNFAATPVAGGANVSATASASYTTPTNTSTLLTAGANGTMVQEIVAVGTGVTVAGMLNFFLLDSSAAYHFWDSFVVPVVTPSATTAPFRLVRDYQNLWLPAGWSLVVASWVAAQLVHVTAMGLNA